jgi:hypothetical protein
VLPVVIHEQSNPTSRHSNLYILEIGSLLQRMSYNSSEIILYERFRDLDCQLLEHHISQISLFHLEAIFVLQ